MTGCASWFLKKHFQRRRPDASKKMCAAVRICRFERKSAPEPTEGDGDRQPT